MAPTSFTYDNLPLPNASKVPSNIKLRKAISTDAKAMADCFYTSFYPSHKFWVSEFKPENFHSWWMEAWTMAITSDPTARIFVAVDTSYASQSDDETTNTNNAKSHLGTDLDKRFPSLVTDGRIVGYTRWRVPQADGNIDDKWPDLPQGEGIDMNILGPFFEGMHNNREELMGRNPHWCKQIQYSYLTPIPFNTEHPISLPTTTHLTLTLCSPRTPRHSNSLPIPRYRPLFRPMGLRPRRQRRSRSLHRRL